MNTSYSDRISPVEFSIDRWREGFLRTFFYITAGIGLIAVLIYVVTSGTPVYIYLAVGFYLVFLAFTFLPMPYAIRASFLIFLLNLISLFTLLDSGILSSATTFFLGTTVISTLIFSPRVGTISTIVNILLISLVGWLTISGQFALFSGASLTGTVSNWILSIVYYSLLSISIVSGIHLLKRDFFITQAQANNLFDSLKVEQVSLADRVSAATRNLTLVVEVSRRLTTILDLQQLVREVVTQLQRAFGYYHAHIYLFDAEKQYLVMAGGTGEAGQAMLARGHKIPKGRGLVGRAADSNAVVLVPDVSQAEGWLPNPLLTETKAEVAVPIAIGSEVLGVLDVQHNITNGLAAQDADLIQAIANQVAIAVQNAQAYERSQRQAQRESRIAAISQHIQAATSIDDVLKIAVSELGQALGAERADIDLKLGSMAKSGKN